VSRIVYRFTTSCSSASRHHVAAVVNFDPFGLRKVTCVTVFPMSMEGESHDIKVHFVGQSSRPEIHAAEPSCLRRAFCAGDRLRSPGDPVEHWSSGWRLTLFQDAQGGSKARTSAGRRPSRLSRPDPCRRFELCGNPDKCRAAHYPACIWTATLAGTAFPSVVELRG